MKILIADDNTFYRTALAATLKGWGYEVIAAADGAAAWDVLRRDDAPKLAILDWMMPKADGVEVCRRVRALQKPEPPYLMVLTSKGGKENVVAALEAGADDFLLKPFDRDELQARLRVGLRIVRLQTSQTVVFAFARAVEAKSPYTQGHADRVTRYALTLARELGLPASDLDLLQRGGVLHDIGKIGIPDAILNKPGKLTPEEYDVIKQHPAQGVKIVEPLESLRDVVPLIRWHHERLDGKGYPDGLAGDAIPQIVRVLSVADVFDAVSSDRPYRPGLSRTVCFEILEKDAAGGGLDADLVRHFTRLGFHAFDPAPVPAVPSPSAMHPSAAVAM
jgi:putative two-component system response regulator